MAEVLDITDKEYRLIDETYDDLVSKMEFSLTDEDRIHLREAYELALESHRHQRRKSGEPYILHPLEVARICYEEIGLGPTAVIAAILHDVVEDTPVTQEDINEKFGSKIGKIVDGLTKLDGMYNVESPQAANFKKVLSTLVDDVRVSLIKMADRLHNLRTIDSMPLHKKLKIAAETSYIYTPLAHRLGLYKIKTEFQDICMKISEPELYYEIQRKLTDTAPDREDYIDRFIDPLKGGLDSLNISYRILGRPKAISSIHNKIKNKKVAFEEIYDLFAVRIIIDVPIAQEKSVCWQVYSVITDVYKPIPERLKDWVTTPKSNGYESLHTSVLGPDGKFVEVQIRSERMDEIAERGFAAHWKYKGVKNDHSVYDQWLDNIRDLLDTQHSDAMEFLNDFKTNLFNEEVYVFTPNGDMRILPKGATALDFAFDIHSDIGYHATAIKVNNKLVPMGYILHNGDQVTVTTSKNQKPNEEWLKMVVTGKARSKIRSSMKEEKRKNAELGYEALERKLRNMKMDFESNVDLLVDHFGLQSRPDLYHEIYIENINVSDLSKLKTENGVFVFKKEPVIQEPAKPPKSYRDQVSKSHIIINGESADHYRFEMANCCKPVQGDEIFAYLTANNHMKIHRTNCPNATHLLANYGYRVLKAEWETTTSRAFVVELLVTGTDTGIGVIQKLTSEISNNLGLNIRSFNISSKGGVFECEISLQVVNKDQLNNTVAALKKLSGINSVIRKEHK